MMTLLLDSVCILLKFGEFTHRIAHPEFGSTCVPQRQQFQAAAVGGSRYGC